MFLYVWPPFYNILFVAFTLLGAFSCRFLFLLPYNIPMCDVSRCVSAVYADGHLLVDPVHPVPDML